MFLINRRVAISKLHNNFLKTRPVSSYVQGQSPAPKIREYFYFIDHEGMLFLDDTRMKNFTSCFKDKKFLQFFFKRLKFNETDRYKDFPYISVCGRELNYIRCDDVPLVFTHVLSNVDEKEMLAANHAHDLLTFDFEPNKIYMAPKTGRVYHPAGPRYGSVGLIRSKLAIEFSKFFDFQDGEEMSPTHFTWNGVKHRLDRDWIKHVRTQKGLE